MEERQIMEHQRKEDQERAKQGRFHQTKLHEEQIQLLQAQIASMSARTENHGGKSHYKMPEFDLDKDKENFKLWKARWEIHVQGNRWDKISDPAERNRQAMHKKFHLPIPR